MEKRLNFLEYVQANHPEFLDEAKQGLLSKVAHILGKLPLTAKILPIAAGTVIGAKGLETIQNVQLVTNKPAAVKHQEKPKKTEKPRGKDKGRFERPHGADA
jgi:hypothetical protein